MTPVTGMDHVNITVADFDATVDWYRRVFGFELVEDEVTDGVHWGVLKGGGCQICFSERTGREFADRFALGDRNLHGMGHFALRIEDAESWQRTLQAHEIPVMYDGVVRWPHSDSWYIQDPTGYEIEVVHWHSGKPGYQAGETH